MDYKTFDTQPPRYYNFSYLISVIRKLTPYRKKVDQMINGPNPYRTIDVKEHQKDMKIIADKNKKRVELYMNHMGSKSIKTTLSWNPGR